MWLSQIRHRGRGRRGDRLRLQHLEERVTPTTFVVSNLLDGAVTKAGDLPGSLRQAIFDANANPGADVVDATGVSGTITLAAGELKVTSELSLPGPGAANLKIDGNFKSSVISVVSSNFAAMSVQISDITLANGKSTGNGGGIIAGSFVKLSLDGLVITGNQAAASGGGVYAGTLIMTSSQIIQNKSGGNILEGGGGVFCSSGSMLTNCEIRSNESTGYGGGAFCYSATTINNCQFINNKTTTNNRSGGGVYSRQNTTILNCLIYSNQSYGDGGGLYCQGSIALVDSTISNNASISGDGAGVYFYGNGTVNSIDRCTVANNTCFQGSGGGFYTFSSAPVISNSTFSGNQANGGSFVYRGGGLYISPNTKLQNCTISNNSAAGYGGGVYGAGQFQNCTIVLNTSIRGGGIDGFNNVRLVSTIVADNFGPPTSPDLFCVGDTFSTDSNIGSLLGINKLIQTGSFIIGSPRLGPLTDNGGPTPTHLPMSGSPVRGTGSNSGGLQFDQRGQPRQIGDYVDIGAIESFDPSPSARSSHSGLEVAGSTEFAFSLTFSDPDGIATASIIGNNGAVRVTGPNGFDQAAQFVSIDDSQVGTTRTAIFKFTAPGGKFGPEDNGTYSIDIQPNHVFDVTGQSVSSDYHFGLPVRIPWTFVVSNLLDGPVSKAGDLPGSLRQAVFDSNSAPTLDTITFDPVVFAEPKTITLTAGMLNLSNSMKLIGAGSELITIQGPSNGIALRVVNTPNSLRTTVFIEKVRIAGSAQGIVNMGQSLELFDCIVSENKSTLGNGAGIVSMGGSVSIVNSTISNNTSPGSGAGIYLNNASSLTLQNSVITGNVSALNGGGIYCYQSQGQSVIANMTIDNSIISGNVANNPSRARDGGGGLFFNGTPYGSTTGKMGSLVVRNSQILNNTTASSGAGIHIGPDSLLTMQNSVVDGNIAGRNGGGVYLFNRGGFLIENSTISNNKSTGQSAFGILGGGGLYFWGIPAALGTTLRHSTISGNQTAVGGGGILLVNTGTFVLENSTVAHNTAATNGGGIAQIATVGSPNMKINATSSIIAKNSHATTPDIITTGQVTADHSLIGVTNGITTLTSTASLTGTLVSPLDPLLAPLADNGGPTKTHVPMPGSPAINKGSNPLNLLYDQRGPGFPRQAGVAPDIGAFEFPLPPVVNATVVADGTTQRSMIRSLTVTFSEAVTFPSGIASAFQLQRTGPGGPTGLVNLAFEQVVNVVTITFDDATYAPEPAKSLIDGKYLLTLVASKIQGAAGLLDGNGDGIGGDSPTTTFHRLFGDADGDGRVNAVDWAAFRGSFGSASAVFDFNNDGVVNAVDYAQFRARFGVMV